MSPGPDVGLALVGEWSTSSSAQQRAAADAAINAWQRVPWPAGLLSYSCMLGTGGYTVLHYSQWADEDACRAFVATDRPQWVRAVDAAAPGIQHRRVTGYRLYRSRYDSTQTPECIILVTRQFDAPDIGRAREWVEAIFAVPGGDRPLPGLIAAHFHLSTDGARVLNYAEWASEDAYRSGTAGAAQRIQDNPQMRRVESWPGLTHTTVRRYHPYRSITTP